MNENIIGILAIMSRMSDRINDLREHYESATSLIKDIKSDGISRLDAYMIEGDWMCMCNRFDMAIKLFESIEDNLISIRTK